MSAPIESHRPSRWDKPFSADMTDADVDRLLSIPPISEIDPARFRSSLSLRDILRHDARIVQCQPGDIVIRKGDWGNSAYLVLSGAMRVELEPPERCMPPEVLGRRDVRKKNLWQALSQWWGNHREPEIRQPVKSTAISGVATRGTGDRTRIYLEDVGAVLNSRRTAELPPGQFFGEIAALGRTQRVATVFADTNTELLEIRWQGLRDIMRNDASIRQHIDRLFRERALASFLRDTPMFRHVNDEELEQLVASAEFHSFGQLDVARPARKQALENKSDLSSEPLVATEGEYPNGVFLVRSGLARLSQKYHHGHLTVGYLTPGHVYGFEEIEAGYQPLKHSLRAIGYLAVVFVPSSQIDTLVLRREPAVGTLATRPPTVVTPKPDIATQPASVSLNQDLIEFFVERRFIVGTAAMIIDTDHCTRCDDCVRACANAHDNNPRFIRHGPRHGHFMVANACMHCADPVCMIECPTGAIHRREAEGQVVINDDTCIGCTQCANNCPFNAIRMVEIRDEQGRLRLDDQNRHIFQATKCDLCSDQLGGPACQRACPHDALQRIDMRNLAAISQMVNR